MRAEVVFGKEKKNKQTETKNNYQIQETYMYCDIRYVT